MLTAKTRRCDSWRRAQKGIKKMAFRPCLVLPSRFQRLAVTGYTRLVHIYIPHNRTPCGRGLGGRSYRLSWGTRSLGLPPPRSFCLDYTTQGNPCQDFFKGFPIFHAAGRGLAPCSGWPPCPLLRSSSGRGFLCLFLDVGGCFVAPRAPWISGW